MKKQSKTNLARIDARTDRSIDTSDIPALDKSFFANAKLRMPIPKTNVTIRIDADVLNWFKIGGKGYQTRINAVLRMYVEVHNR